MISEVKKIFNDTLKSPSGKYSRKSLTMLSSYGITIVMTLTNFFFPGFILDPMVIGFYMALAGGNNALVFWDKKQGSAAGLINTQK